MRKRGKKIRQTWLAANKFYLIPVMGFLFIVNSALSLAGLLVILFLYLSSVARARLPIDPGGRFNRVTREYRTTGTGSLKLDVWYPARSKRPFPVVFFAHGGGWVSGFRNQPNNVSWCRFLASRGFAVVSIDYRYGLTSTMEEILSDYTAALDYIRDNARSLDLDSENIILMGLSAGGHLALLYAAYYTNRNESKKITGIRGVTAYYAPSDLRDIFSSDDKSVFARFATAATLKGTPRSSGEAYRYYSPIEWVTGNMVPVVVVHGREDTVVPFRSSTSLVRKMKSLGIHCRFLIHRNGGHGFETKRKDLRTTLILMETVKSMKEMTIHDH